MSLYLKQYARMLEERGETEAVPESVQGIIAARLDGLSGEEKALLQDAAVIGKVFWSGAVGGRAELLHALERKEFVQRARRSSIAGETEYAFRHLLVRDVAYGQIPRAERAQKHRHAAEWIETLGRPEDHAEMLAHHWTAALELARAAGHEDEDLTERARLALRDAGDRALVLNAFAAAVGYYEQALELASEGGDLIDLLFRRAHALHLGGDERREEALVEAGRELLAAGDNERAAELEAYLAQVWWFRGKRAEVSAHLARARELVASAPDSPAKARVLAFAARYAGLAGDASALELGEEALRLGEALDLGDVKLYALTAIGLAKGPPDGMPEMERSYELALAANSPEATRAANNLGVYTGISGDIRRAGELWKEAYRLAERFGDRQIILFQQSQLVAFYIWTGDWARGLPLADGFLAECEQQGSSHYQEPEVRSLRALVRLARGDRDGALDDVRRCVELTREVGDPQAFLVNFSSVAFIYAELGYLDEAAAVARELLPFAKGRPGWAPFGIYALALDAARLGVADAVRDALESGRPGRWRDAGLALLEGDLVRAAELLNDAGNVVFAAAVRLRAAERMLEEGRWHEGQDQLHRGLAFFRSVDATAYIRRGEALLAASA